MKICSNEIKTKIFLISLKSSIEWYINESKIKWCGNFDFGEPYKGSIIVGIDEFQYLWVYVQWSSQLLSNELSLAFELIRISKIVPDGLMLDLVPKTEPRMIAPINRTVNKQIGMANLFLRYQWRLLKCNQQSQSKYN